MIFKYKDIEVRQQIELNYNKIFEQRKTFINNQNILNDGLTLKYADINENDIQLLPENIAEQELLIINKYNYAPIDSYKNAVTFDEIKSLKLKAISTEFKEFSKRPVISINIDNNNIEIDAGRSDLENYKNAQKFGITFIVDAYKHKHNIMNDSNWAIIIDTIEMYGIKLYQRKWELEELVESSLTIADIDNILISF